MSLRTEDSTPVPGLPDPRRAGRTTTQVLTILALVSISGLVFGVIRLIAPAGEGSDRGRSGLASSAPTAGAGPAAGVRAPNAEIGGGPAGASSGAAEPVAEGGATALEDSEDPTLAGLGERPDGDRSAEGDWERTGRVRPGTQPGGSSTTASVGNPSNLYASRLPGESQPAPTGPPGTPFTPGYVEVLGVLGRSAALDAGFLRGMKILEYNNQPVAGRLDLEAAWAAPGLPDSVPVLVQTRGGETQILVLPPGAPGALLSPRYNQ